MLVGVLLYAPASAQRKKKKSKHREEAAPAGELIPMNPDLTMGTLDNGLTYYIQKNTEPAKRADLYMVTRTGSAAEDDDQQGLAHFTEHMAFNGTTHFPKDELIDYLQKAGVRFGADLNAYTSFNETVFQLPLPTDNAELFTQGFTILADWAAHITFEGDEIDQERGVILEEDRQRGKDAGERMREQLMPVLLANSRYGQRIPIGKVDILKTFKYEAIKRYYHDWYRPDLQAVIVVGDIDVAQVEALIKKNFGDLKNPKKERAHVSYPLPMANSPVAKIVTDPEYAYYVATVFYRHQGGVTKTKKDLRAQICASMINDMFRQRIQEITQSGQAPFVQASGRYGAYQGGLGNAEAFTLTAVAKDAASLEESMKGILTEAYRMKKYGFTASELERVKTANLASIERAYNERDKTSSGSLVKQYVQHFTTGSPYPGTTYYYEFFNEVMPLITVQEVNAMADTLMNENITAIIQASSKQAEDLPDEKTYLSWLTDKGLTIEPYQDDVADGELLTELPKPGSITSEKAVPALGATEWQLSNGIRVVVKPTDFKNDQVLIYAFSPGGSSLADDDVYLSASIAPRIIGSSGAGAYTNVQLNKLLSGKQINISPYIATDFEGITGSSTPKDLESALQLMWLYVTNPRLDTAVFRVTVDQYRVNLSGRDVQPTAIYKDTIQAVMSNYNPRSKTPTVKDLDALDPQFMYRFYKDRFKDTNDFTFVFVGNLDLEALKPLVAQYIASLPAAGRQETYVDHHIAPVKGPVVKKVYKGLEEKSIVSMFYYGTYDYSLKNNVMLDLIESALSTKLTQRLREKESGAYSPSVKTSYSKFPNEDFTCTIQYSCDPTKAQQLIDATRDEVRKIREEGVTADDIEKFVAQQKRQMEIHERENDYWAGYLRLVYNGAYTPDYRVAYLAMLDTLTPEMTVAYARAFLQANSLKEFILYPENSAN